MATVVPFLVWGLALGWQRLAARPVVAAGLAGLVLASVALCTLAGAHFPHYPLQFDNPVFDLTIPLLAAGYAPYGLGWLLGLRGAASYLPLAAAVLTAVVLAVRSLRLRPAGVAVALAVAVTFVGGLALYGRRYHPDETMALGVVQSLWEPPARGGGDGAP